MVGLDKAVWRKCVEISSSAKLHSRYWFQVLVTVCDSLEAIRKRRLWSLLGGLVSH